MNRTIRYKSNRLFYVSMMILMLFSIITRAQTQERVINLPAQTLNGAFTTGGCGLMVPTQVKGIEVIEIKAGDKPVVFGQSFTANEDWLKTLSIKIRNVSDKTINLVDMSFNLPEASTKEMGFGFVIGNGDVASFDKNRSRKIILPGEEAVLTRSDVQYDRDSKGIAQRTGKSDFHQIITGVTTVRFADGELWTSWKLPLSNQNASADTNTTAAESDGHRLSGTVKMKSDGQPVAKAVVEVMRINFKAAGGSPYQNCTLSDDQGRWSLDNVPDGEYQIMVGSSRPSSMGSAETKFIARRYEMKISGADIAGLAVEASKGGTVTGRVIMEGGESLPKGLVVWPEQTIQENRVMGRAANVQPDGTFILEGVPIGPIRLKVFVFGKLNEYLMKSATVNDIDLLRETIKIEDGSEVKDVRVVFAKATEK